MQPKDAFYRTLTLQPTMPSTRVKREDQNQKSDRSIALYISWRRRSADAIREIGKPQQRCADWSRVFNSEELREAAHDRKLTDLVCGKTDSKILSQNLYQASTKILNIVVSETNRFSPTDSCYCKKTVFHPSNLQLSPLPHGS